MSLPTTGRPVAPTTSALRPLGIHEVTITDGFWARRQELNRTAILDHVGSWLERAGWLPNFDAAVAGTLPAARRGREFSDSEPYKYLEALAWELGRRRDPALEARFHAVVARIAAAQEPDGYLNTMFGRPGQGERWSDLEWGHELYCAGHLLQAAVARARTGYPDDLLVAVAGRAADLVCDVFGPDGDQRVCGHPVIEVGLAELGRALDRPRYVEQAALFVDRRGHGVLADIEWGRSYYQDDVPLRDADVFGGHAVRANYLAAGALDAAIERGDTDLVDAVGRQFRATQSRRTYLTGGQGSRHQDEGFGDDFQLPPDRAYSETCAAIASGMVAWRLLLASGDPACADAMERTLYNVVATSPAADGRSFYYANTLHQRVPGQAPDPLVPSNRAEASLRAPWFEVSCCPPNVARTFASLGAYLATTTEDGLQIHQYAPCRIATDVEGSPVVVEVETDYPASGRVGIRVVEAPESFALTLRIPAWCAGATVAVDGAAARRVGAGKATVPAGPGVVVELDLDLAPRFVVADERVDAVRGCVAVVRGPEVWCLESVDVPGTRDVASVRVDASVAPWDAEGRVVVRGWVLDDPGAPEDPWPYAPIGARRPVGADRRAVDIPLVAYHDWANRGPSTMRVWLPVGGAAPSSA